LGLPLGQLAALQQDCLVVLGLLALVRLGLLVLERQVLQALALLLLLLGEVLA
jgi:hypothetical protein